LLVSVAVLTAFTAEDAGDGTPILTPFSALRASPATPPRQMLSGIAVVTPAPTPHNDDSEWRSRERVVDGLLPGNMNCV
jgi:hypothetical protein